MTTPVSEPPKGTIIKRSVRIAGHSTSISLEPVFWRELEDLAARQGCTLGELIARVDAGRSGNLSSTLRVYVVEALRATLPRS